jgi:hypothetical protein
MKWGCTAAICSLHGMLQFFLFNDCHSGVGGGGDINKQPD